MIRTRERELGRIEMAAELGVSVATLDRWSRPPDKGGGLYGAVLPSRKVGDRVRYRWSDYLSWQAEVDRRRLLARTPPPRTRRDARAEAEGRAALARHGL